MLQALPFADDTYESMPVHIQILHVSACQKCVVEAPD